MYRSSIFNFETLHLRPIRSLISNAVLLTIAGLVLIELFVRSVVPDNELPKYAYHSAELRQQVEQYREFEKIDLLIVGSSIAAVNFPPDSIDTTLHEAGMEGFVTFNAGIRGCNYSCIHVGLKKHYLDQKNPKYALLVISPLDLDHSNAVQVRRSQDFVTSFSEKSYQRWFEATMSRISYLYAFDDEIRSFIAKRRWPEKDAVVLLRGHVNMGGENRQRHNFDYSFDSESDPARSLQKLIKDLIRKDVMTILLPVLGDNMSRSRMTEQLKSDFLIFLESIARNNGALYLPVSEAHLNDKSYIDPVHLNYVSAMKNGENLARRLTALGILSKDR